MIYAEDVKFLVSNAQTGRLHFYLCYKSTTH